MRSGASSTQAHALRRKTTSKGCNPAFIAWRENTASPANRAMEMVIQITPAIGSPAAGGTIAALLGLILTSDIRALPSRTCTPQCTLKFLRQTAGPFRGVTPLHTFASAIGTE